MLEAPLFKYPFRAIDSARRIFLLDKIKIHNTTFDFPLIAVKFPFDHNLNKLLDKIPGRKTYSVDHRCHCYKLNEENIRTIMVLFKDKDFIIESQITDWYEEINNIIQHPTEYVPSVIIDSSQVKVINCNQQTNDYFNNYKTGKIIEDLFLAKTMNLFFPGKIIESLIDMSALEMSKKLIAHGSHAVSVTDYSREETATMINDLNAFPVLMLIDEKENELKNWVMAFNNSGIENSSMSVLFRSDKDIEFNDFVKNEQLNNLVEDNTKVVFVKQKMPKILYKINFTPKIVISSSSFFAHYTSQKMVDSHPIVLYYTEKQAIGKKIAKL